MGPFAQYANTARFIGIWCGLETSPDNQKRVYISLTVLLSRIITSLVPRLLVGREKKVPGIHCLCIRLVSQKSWEIGNYRVIFVQL